MDQQNNKRAKIMKRYHLNLACALVLLPGLAFAGGSKTVVTVNGEVITSRELAGRVMQELGAVKARNKFTAKMGQKLEKRVLQSMIDEELLFQEAKRQKVVPGNAAMKKAVAMVAKKNGGRDKLLKQLKASHRSISDLKRGLRREMALRAAVKKLVLDPSVVSDKQAKAHYAANSEKFKRPAMIKVRQIFIKVKKRAKKKTWKKAEARANEIVAKLKAGTEWATLAKEEIERHRKKKKLKKKKKADKRDSTKEGKWIYSGSLLPDLDQLAFSLKKGEVGGPVKMSVGYVLIRLDDKRESKPLAFKDVAVELKKSMYAERTQKKLVALMKKLHGKAKIVRNK
jgi:foldase protein PrsA